MSGDSLRDVAVDLARYLRQQQEDGAESYFDEGAPAPVVPAGAAAAASVKPPESAAPAAPAVSPKPARTVRPAAPSAGPEAAVPGPPARPVAAAKDADADAKAAREEAFRRECEAFVKDTLAQIRLRAGVPAPAESGDLFVPADDDAPAPPTGDRKREALAEMDAEVSVCTACKLHAGRIHTVFGSGDPDAGIVFVGEAPGRNEDEQGLPFVGRAGKLLTDILKAIRLSRDEVYICNILKCRPPENRDPERDEVTACEPFLRRQLAIIRPRVICCLGRHAAMTLLDTRASLRSLRESVHFYEGIPVMATYHPAALLRNPHWKRDTWDDVRRLRALHDALVAEEK